MADSVLKKQFQERDIQRLRNLVKGKHGDRVTVGVGYTKEQTGDHNEGDTWEENGRKWTIRDGIKENITKLDKFKKAAVPLFCPSCKSVMESQLDPHYFKAYGSCLNCRTQFETKLKLEGKWEAYLIDMHNKEIDQTIEEYKSYIEDTLSESNNNYVTEDGDVQKWVGGIDKVRAMAAMEETINYLNSLKK
jgi:transcription elongation factor Elf1